jgi:hypothetical protein
LLRNDLGDAQPMPDGLKDIQRAKGPGIHQAPLRRLRHDLFGGTALEKAAGQLAQAFGRLGIISPPTIVDNADFGAFFVGIPHALGQLQMGDYGAIGSLLTGLT